MEAEAHVTVETEWFREEAGERKGPFTEQEMVEQIKGGKLTYGGLVWKKGYPEWRKLELSDLRVHLEEVSPPPLSGAHVNNTVVWVLAFAPVLGYLLEHFVAGMFEANQAMAMRAASSSKYWFVTYGLNVGLSYFDEHRLKLAGHDTSKFKGWAWLVPVYLFQRAKRLNQKMWYFAVWIACFALVLVD